MNKQTYDILYTLGKRGVLQVIEEIHNQTSANFNKIRMKLKMTSSRLPYILSMLVKKRLVEKKITRVRPSRTEYRLTSYGKSILSVIQKF